MEPRRKRKKPKTRLRGEATATTRSSLCPSLRTWIIAAIALLVAQHFLVQHLTTAATSQDSSPAAEQSVVESSIQNHKAPATGLSQLPVAVAVATATATTTAEPAAVSNASRAGTEEGLQGLEDRDSGRDLWSVAVAASVPRGQLSKGGKVTSRIGSYEKRRKGPRRFDGKAWKAGEAGCPQVPTYEKLKGGELVKGDVRLRKMHFVHVPKSGGTTFGQVVIAVACEINSAFKKSLDCCTDPRDWCGENCEPIPDCKAIYGCNLCHCHHVPRLHRMADAHFSVTILRHPMTRFISGFFYRAHSPNWDRFGLRPGYFRREKTYPFKFSFDDYLGMPEYQNILVKMFARDKFPYFNASLTQVDVALAKERLSKFLVVGINEAYDASVQLLLSLTGVTTLRDDQIHLPAAMTSTFAEDYERFKRRAAAEAPLRRRIQTANQLDLDVYHWSVGVFCNKLRAKFLQHFDKLGVCG